MLPLVYIIIINYNNYQDTIECIGSLEKISYKNFEILIIDNNSSNDSINKIKASFNKYETIQLKDNLGFAGGNNVGIKKAMEDDADFILLLNNDTIVETNFLDEMINSFYNNAKNVGIVGPKIYSYYNKQLSEDTGNIDFFKFTTNNNSYNKNKNKYELGQEVNFISGCCMLIKKEVFDTVGFLPEEYFMYYEDTDFCTKALEKEFKILYNPKALIYHKESSSTGGKESPFSIKWNNRNRIIFMHKYKYKVSKFSFLCSKLYIYVTRFIRILQYIFKNDKERAYAIYDGLREGRKYVQNKHNNTLL